MQEAFWALVNPEQTAYISVEKVREFLMKLQTFAIDIPLVVEQKQEKNDQIVVNYLKQLQKYKDPAIRKTM